MATPGTLSFPTLLDSAISLFETANRISSALSLDITNSDTSLSLDTISGWPTSGAVSFPDTGEIAYYTGKTGSTLTGLIRGVDGTTAAAHLSGTSVRLNFTSRHHQVLSEGIVALETKVGINSSTPTLGKFLRGSGIG